MNVATIEDPLDCGAGMGEHCCAFLVCGREGFACGREMASIAITIRQRLSLGTMNAKRDPGETPFPECQMK